MVTDQEGPLAGRVAVVTGGGRGIGRALALGLAEAGAAVVVSSRSHADLDEVVVEVEGLGGRAAAVVADAGRRESAGLPVAAAMAEFGRIDVLVNNVGGTAKGPVDPFEGDLDAIEETIALNLLSAFWATRPALPVMREQGYGRVISIGSGASRHAAASWPYTTAKHGLVGFTRQLAQDGGVHGITANCLCPGWTNTSLIDFEAMGARTGRTAAEARRYAESQNAQQRILEPEELVAIAVLLASPAGNSITGQTFGVDGGYRL
ncbi:MAG: SDR family NAD(P)-dependent oxidoreductase [Acidimicrobiales bacterium]